MNTPKFSNRKIYLFGILAIVGAFLAMASCASARADTVGSARVEVFWTDTNCIRVIDATGKEFYPCGGSATFVSPAISGTKTGVNPIMGSATTISCTFYLNGLIEYTDLAIRGDGTDVNCILQIYDRVPENGRYV